MFMLSKKKALERIAGIRKSGFTGIDSHNHKWVNGKQVHNSDVDVASQIQGRHETPARELPEQDADDDDDDSVEDKLSSLGLNLDRSDIREIESLKEAGTIMRLSEQSVRTVRIKITDIKGHDDIDDSDAIDDPDDVPPLIVGYDGDLIDGHHRLSGLKKGGQKTANVIVADEEDLKAAKQFGGLQGRGSWSEETWIAWMLARAELPQNDQPVKSFRLSKSFAEFRINKDGYTGVITDRAGHRRKYVNGKPVAFDNSTPYTIRTSATEPEGNNRQPKIDPASEKKRPDKASGEPAKNATGGKPAEAKKEGGVFSKLMSIFGGGDQKQKESAPAPEPAKREEGKPISQATMKAVSSLHADASKKGQAAIKAIVNDPAWKGPKGEEGAKAVRKALDDAYAKAELTVNMVPEYLAGAMHEGRIKSAYEGKGVSKGKQYMAVRTQQEKAVFGAGSDVPNEDRPKYGAINWAGNLYGAAGGYGAGVVILHKDKVKDRMTFTPGNSFGHRDPSMVGGGDDHHVAAAGTAAALKAAGIESSNKKLSPGYTEAQIWGDLAFDKDTVKEIRFPASAAYSNHVEWVVDVGKSMGIPVTFFHEKTGKSISYEEAQTEAAKVHKWFKPKQKKKGLGNGKNQAHRGTISRKPSVSRPGRVFRPVGASA